MTSSRDDQFRAALIDTTAWPLIEREVSGAPLTGPLDENAAWTSLVAAGIATAPGDLDDAWRHVLLNMREARVGFRLHSEMSGVIFSADITVHDGLAVSLLRRLGRDARGEITLADPQLELAVTDSLALWPLCRRVLPPRDDFRAPSTCGLRRAARNPRPRVGASGASVPPRTIRRRSFCGHHRSSSRCAPAPRTGCRDVDGFLGPPPR